MVKYIDDGVLLGWYFCKEGCCWGDGTKKMAERIEKEMAEDGRDRSNTRLNEAIEQHIAQWDGTVHGFCIKNMWENGADYESICEAANIDIEDYEDD